MLDSSIEGIHLQNPFKIQITIPIPIPSPKKTTSQPRVTLGDEEKEPKQGPNPTPSNNVADSQFRHKDDVTANIGCRKLNEVRVFLNRLLEFAK